MKVLTATLITLVVLAGTAAAVMTFLPAASLLCYVPACTSTQWNQANSQAWGVAATPYSLVQSQVGEGLAYDWANLNNGGEILGQPCSFVSLDETGAGTCHYLCSLKITAGHYTDLGTRVTDYVQFVYANPALQAAGQWIQCGDPVPEEDQ